MRNFFISIVCLILSLGAIASIIGGFFVEYQWKLKGIETSGGYVFGGLVGAGIMSQCIVTSFGYLQRNDKQCHCKNRRGGGMSE